jgi:hypothetical protein
MSVCDEDRSPLIMDDPPATEELPVAEADIDEPMSVATEEGSVAGSLYAGGIFPINAAPMPPGT